jgi:hypothetical protein
MRDTQVFIFGPFWLNGGDERLWRGDEVVPPTCYGAGRGKWPPAQRQTGRHQGGARATEGNSRRPSWQSWRMTSGRKFLAHLPCLLFPQQWTPPSPLKTQVCLASLRR